jgi:phosphatidylserine decarboxylase
MYKFLRYVPKNHLSYFLGRLVHTPLSKPFLRWFAQTYKIDVNEAEKPMEHYDSIGHFFTRNLKEGLRPIEGEIVSPVDGTLRNFGIITGGVLEQVKGRDYSVEAFLGSKDLAQRFDGGTFFNLYLSPQDYHHVHAPVTGLVTHSTHVPGRLWPVNDWSMNNIENLFSVNERILTLIESPVAGAVAVVMVGATNVGKMSVTYDGFISNNLSTSETEHRVYEPGRPLQAGERLGTFHMGSTVVMLFERDRIALADVPLSQPQKVRYGQALVGRGGTK